MCSTLFGGLQKCMHLITTYIYYQILMSVQQALTHATSKPHVWILMEVTFVHVTVDTLEMDKAAMVSISFRSLSMSYYVDNHLCGTGSMHDHMHG